jgi:hypothetical protein
MRKNPDRQVRARRAVLAELVLEEPPGVQRVDRAIGLHAGDRCVHRGDEIAAFREDEAEILGPQLLADDLEPAARGLDIARAGGAIGQHQVHIARLQRLDRGAEGLEKLDPGVRLVAVQHLVDPDIEGRRARLRGHQQLGVGREGFRVGEARLVAAHHHHHLGGHVAVGEVHLLLAVVADGDAGHPEVILALRHGRDHRVPADVLVSDGDVQALGDLGHRVVFPPHGGTRGVKELQRRIGVLGHHHDLAALKVRQVLRQQRRGRKEKAKKGSGNRLHVGEPPVTD